MKTIVAFLRIMREDLGEVFRDLLDALRWLVIYVPVCLVLLAAGIGSALCTVCFVTGQELTRETIMPLCRHYSAAIGVLATINAGGFGIIIAYVVSKWKKARARVRSRL